MRGCLHYFEFCLHLLCPAAGEGHSHSVRVGQSSSACHGAVSAPWGPSQAGAGNASHESVPKAVEFGGCSPPEMMCETLPAPPPPLHKHRLVQSPLPSEPVKFGASGGSCAGGGGWRGNTGSRGTRSPSVTHQWCAACPQRAQGGGGKAFLHRHMGSFAVSVVAMAVAGRAGLLSQRTFIVCLDVQTAEKD